jgi:thioredoxin 1
MKILKFSASWCGPCKTLAAVIEEAGIGSHTLEEIDIETASAEVKAKYAIRSIPTLIAVNEDGAEMLRSVGKMSVPQFQTWISKLNG